MCCKAGLDCTWGPCRAQAFMLSSRCSELLSLQQGAHSSPVAPPSCNKLSRQPFARQS